MAELLDRLDLPADWADYPETAKHDHLQNNVKLEDFTRLVIAEYELPESDREGFPYLNKEQWIALVRELDGDSE